MAKGDICSAVPVAKRNYTTPTLTIYGDISEITLKAGGVKDHNHSDSNDMGPKNKDVTS